MLKWEKSDLQASDVTKSTVVGRTITFDGGIEI